MIIVFAVGGFIMGAILGMLVVIIFKHGNGKRNGCIVCRMGAFVSRMGGNCKQNVRTGWVVQIVHCSGISRISKKDNQTPKFNLQEDNLKVDGQFISALC